MRMIGRKKRLGVLFDAYCSKKNELLIVYGRKKIGKTYLVEKAFRNRIVFKYDGNNDLKGTSKFKKQLQNFSNNLAL